MDTTLFTSFDGRINRAKWWLGTIIMIVLSMVIFFIVTRIMGVSMMAGLDAATMGPGAVASAYRSFAIAQAIMLLIIAYPVTALMKKRLNDRDRPDWLVYVFWAPTVVSVVLALAGLGYTTMDVSGVNIPTPTTLTWIVNLAGFVIGLWALIELGFLKGTEGPNRHGPDPLAT